MYSRVQFLGEIIEYKNKCDLILSRAVSKISNLIYMCSPILKKNGKLIMMKKIKNDYKEITESLNLMYANKIKIKSMITTSLLKEGKIVYILDKKF